MFLKIRLAMKTKKTALILVIVIFSAFLPEYTVAQDFSLFTDSVRMFWPPAPLEKPAYLEPVNDPDFGTSLTRVTGDPGTVIPVIGGQWKDIVRHGYSKVPAWNADESILYLETQRGGPSPLFLDGETYEVLFSKKLSCKEKRWHPEDPELMVALRDTAVITWNIRSDQIDELVKITGYRDCQMGPWEGNLSYDGNWMAVYATRISDGVKVGFMLDLANAVKHPDVDLTGVDVDWVSASCYRNVHGGPGHLRRR